MDFLLEFVIEIFGGIIEAFFGQTPLKKLPRPWRFVLLFVFWYGFAALFCYFSYALISTSKLAAAGSLAVAVALGALGAYFIAKSNRTDDSPRDNSLQNGDDGDELRG